MEIFKKWWVRLLISLFLLGILSEVFSITTGKVIHPIITLGLFIVLYIGSSIVYGFHLRKKDKMNRNDS